jgi:hypothetical protein
MNLVLLLVALAATCSCGVAERSTDYLAAPVTGLLLNVYNNTAVTGQPIRCTLAFPS